MRREAQLHILEAGRLARIIALRDTVTIGGDSANDIVLESNAVSRHHAALVRNDAGLLLIIDLASTIAG